MFLLELVKLSNRHTDYVLNKHVGFGGSHAFILNICAPLFMKYPNLAQ